MITIRSKVRYAQSFELTDACHSEKTPSTTMTVVQWVDPSIEAAMASFSRREGAMRKERTFPPTLTLGAKETVADLPDAVATAPEIVAAVKAGFVVVTKPADLPETEPKVKQRRA